MSEVQDGLYSERINNSNTVRLYQRREGRWWAWFGSYWTELTLNRDKYVTSRRYWKVEL